MIPDHSIPDGVKCTCGRNMNEVHCPNCGSFHLERRLRGFKPDEIGYRCQRCKLLFEDKLRAQCEAKPQQLMRTVRAEEQLNEIVRNMTPEQRREAAFETLRKIGKK